MLDHPPLPGDSLTTSPCPLCNAVIRYTVRGIYDGNVDGDLSLEGDKRPCEDCFAAAEDLARKMAQPA